jgi:hypothetical protein
MPSIWFNETYINEINKISDYITSSYPKLKIKYGNNSLDNLITLEFMANNISKKIVKIPNNDFTLQNIISFLIEYGYKENLNVQLPVLNLPVL